MMMKKGDLNEDIDGIWKKSGRNSSILVITNVIQKISRGSYFRENKNFYLRWSQ